MCASCLEHYGTRVTRFPCPGRSYLSVQAQATSYWVSRRRVLGSRSWLSTGLCIWRKKEDRS
jgi:hypothetical protein